MSNFSMRMLWRPVFCLWGLILFGLLTYGSIRVNRDTRYGHHRRYFWWGSVCLDSDPLNRQSTLELMHVERRRRLWLGPRIHIGTGRRV